MWLSFFCRLLFFAMYSIIFPPCTARIALLWDIPQSWMKEGNKHTLRKLSGAKYYVKMEVDSILNGGVFLFVVFLCECLMV